MSESTRQQSARQSGARGGIPAPHTPPSSTGGALGDLMERASRPIGAFRSGRTDLAEKHDEALAEILEEEMARWRLPE